MTTYAARIAHVLAVYLGGLLSIALGITHGNINRASLLAVVPAAVTFTVETARHLLAGQQSLDNLVKLGEQVEPLVEKYLPAVKGLVDNPLIEKLLHNPAIAATVLNSGYGKSAPVPVPVPPAPAPAQAPTISPLPKPAAPAAPQDGGTLL